MKLRNSSATLSALTTVGLLRYVALQLGVARAVDLAHAASADGREDFVVTDFIAWMERHLDVRAKFIRSTSG
jgi:hypothetical protein